MRLFLFQAGLLSTIACSSSSNVKPIDDAGPALPTGDTGTHADGDDTGEFGTSDAVDVGPDAGPCGPFGWGQITDPETTLHIAGSEPDHQLDSSLRADGSMTHPFRDIEEFQIFLAGEPTLSETAIALWPGIHELQPGSTQALAQTTLPLQNCGPASTQLKPAADLPAGMATVQIHDGASLTLDGFNILAVAGHSAVSVGGSASLALSNANVSGEIGAPAIKVHEDSALSMSDVDVTGGTTGVWTDGNATSLTINSSSISGSSMAGVWTDGNATSLTDVTIEAISGISGMVGTRAGWGVVIRNGPVSMNNVRIKRVKRSGLVLQGASGNIQNLRVESVSPTDEGQLGRGIHIAGTWGTDMGLELTDIEVENVHDVGILVRNAHNLKLTNIDIKDVAPGSYEIPSTAGDDPEEEEVESPGASGLAIPEDVETIDTGFSSEDDDYDDTTGTTVTMSTGDGLIVLQRDWPGEDMDAEHHHVTLDGENHFEGISRAGIIADASALSLVHPSTMDAGHTAADGWSIFTQHCATLTWLDFEEGGVTGMPVPDDSPFGFYEADFAMSDEDDE